LNIPAEIKNDPDFKKNQKKFFGVEQSDTKSEWNRNVGKFFGGDAKATNAPMANTVGDKFLNVQTNV
jgi:hypothetical protein